MSVSRPQYDVRARGASSRPRLLRRRLAAADALGLAVLAAVLAGIWTGRQAAPAATPSPVQQVSAGDARLTVPASWRRASLGAAGLPGLSPARSAAVSLRADVPTWAVVTTTPADHASLVPLALRRLFDGPLPPPRETRLGDRGAWLYTGLTTRGGRALELTVQPTTAGVLTVACVAPASARPPEPRCGGAVSSATVRGATTLAAGPAAALALAMKPRLQALDGTRVKLRAGLSRADSAGAQEGLARRLAGAHLDEARALAPLAATAGAPLVLALRKVGSAYEDLATAAAGGSRAAFSTARQDVDAAEARLADAIGSVSRRIAPESAPPLPSTAPPPASGPSSLLLVFAIVSLVAALALVYGPRARARRTGASTGSALLALLRQASLLTSPRPPRRESPKRAAATSAVEAASSRGKSLTPARTEAPARLGKARAPARVETPAHRAKSPATARGVAPARRDKSPTRSRRTPSAMPGTPVTTPLAQPVAALPTQDSARPTKRSDPSPTARSAARSPARRKPSSKPAAPPARRAKGPAAPRAEAPRRTKPAAAPRAEAPRRTKPAAAPRTEAARRTKPAAAPRAEPARRTKPPAAPRAEAPRRTKPAAAPRAEPARRAKRVAPASAAPAALRNKPRSEPTAVTSRAAAAAPAPAPSATGWTCEITWRAGFRAAAFRAAAARPDGDPQEIAQSAPVQWPPVLPPAPAPDLVDALVALEKRLIAAGWTPIRPRAPEWYRRRFAWTAAEPPRPLPVTSGPDSEWTCEIVWKAGLRGAGFRAHAARSGEREQLVVARSQKLDWPPLLPPRPDDELVAAAEVVERALIASGWKPAGRGSAWYAHRFAWTSDDAPVEARSPA